MRTSRSECLTSSLPRKAGEWPGVGSKRRARPPSLLVASALLFSALALASCIDTPDFASSVHDLRVLAVRSEPPQLMFDIDPRNPKTLLKYVGKTFEMKLRALVVDPAGGGREVSYRFTGCFRTENARCVEDDPDTFFIGKGVLANDEATATLRIDFDLVQKALEKDSLKGFGGIQLPISLYVQAGGEEVWTLKRVVLSMKQVEGQTANENPPVPIVTLDDAIWLPGEQPEIRRLTAKADVVPYGDGPETYVVQKFDLSTAELKENWDYAWFTTRGRFNPQRSGGVDPTSLAERSTRSELNLEFADSGDLDVWCVLRDGRGGETWTKRSATFSRPPGATPTE